MVSINKSEYRDKECLVLETDRVAVTVLPYGGRMVSMLDKSINKEFLVQQEGNKYNAGEYGSDYVEAGPAGFDDMFPTISKTFYPDHPWEGFILPDHGEVWSLPWEYNIENDAIKMSVNGVRLPYVLEKKIGFSGEKEIRIDYTATNQSSFDMKFIWAAHPMLIAEKEMEFELPPECNRAISVLDGSNRTGKYGNVFNWKDLASQKINMFRDSGMQNVEKYYFLDRIRHGFIKIKYPSTGSMLSIDFPEGKVPCIGILIDEGSWKKDKMFMIPEPCTAPMDRVDMADLYGRSSVIAGNSSYSWYLSLTVSHSEL